MNGLLQVVQPTHIARWSLFAFALGLLGYELLYADGLLVAVLQLVLLPWVCGPAALLMLFVRGGTPVPLAWALVAGEVAVIGSTVWLWATLHFNPDAQNGIAMMLFPAVQFAGVAIYMGVVGLFGYLVRAS